MKHFSKIIGIYLVLAAFAFPLKALDLAKDFVFKIEKWEKNPEGNFTHPTIIKEKELRLRFYHDKREKIDEEFDGFTLEILSYAGCLNSSLTVEQNLSKPGHPFNDPVIGISSNHFTVEKPEPQGNQISYMNYYVNVDDTTKYRIVLKSKL